MKHVGYRDILIADLKLPGNWRQVLDDPFTKSLAESIRTFSQLQEPVVRRDDKMLLAGAHRVAAHVLLGLPRCYCKVVDCSDDEAAAIAKVENAHRGHNVEMQQKDVLALVELTAKVEEQRRQDPDADKPRKTAKTVAREIVAAKMGVTPGALRQAEHREKLRRADTKDIEKRDFAIRSIGMEFHESFIDSVRLVAEKQDEAARCLTRAATILTGLSNSKMPVHTDRLGHVRTELATISKMLRGMKPSSLCPYCKGCESIASKCTACMGTSYIASSQEVGVPLELWDEQEPKVAYQGKILPLDEFLPDETATPEAANIGNELTRNERRPRPVTGEEEEDLWG